MLYYKVETQDPLARIAKERHYKHIDIVTLNLVLFNNDIDAYNAKMQQFYKEHYHEDEEIRYIVEGEGYFDVRDKNEQWIRTKLYPQDMLILPAGIYHRFTLTSELKYVKAVRLFQDEPKWEAINRELNQSSEARETYLKQISV